MSDDIKCVLELDAGMPMRQCRFAPMKLGGRRAFLAVHSNCEGIDPWPPYFRLPTDTLKVTAFAEDGKRMWQIDLGAGMVPGVWFCPVMPFDLDGDGEDEVFLLRNSRPEHALDAGALTLDRLAGRTGELIDSHPWPKPSGNQPLSHLWRNFLNAAFSHGRRRLITAQGTYGPMQLQCWDEQFNTLWTRRIRPDEEPGPLGSHMFPVLDIDGDGRDELFWGERCIDVDTGEDIFVAGGDTWRGHSDVVQPTLDLASGKWLIYTCRETPSPADQRGVVMFDDHGNELWGLRGLGHMHVGWAARLCDDRSHLCYAFDVDANKEYCFDTAGNQPALPFTLNRTMPVDIDGDGRHELVYSAKEDLGRVIARDGKDIGHVDGKPGYCGRVLDLPGEQIICWPKYDATTVIRIYAIPSARATGEAAARYEHPFYDASLRLWPVGYNWRNASGV
jgi:hypothetical protein